MHVLVTGGAGYIGSHTCVELLQSGYDVTVIDNLSNSKLEALTRVQEITERAVTFRQIDLLDRSGLAQLFADKTFDAVVHFAGLKAVGESVSMPLTYYHNNITGTINLLQAMGAYGCKRLVFSSSATVYGNADIMPLHEELPRAAANPYGRTKLMIEEVLLDLAHADSQWAIGILRYFNPVGAHPSGRIGEDPNGVPTNLFPYLTQVAIGKLPQLSVFGGDYPTPDGTGVRDYIHVVDLAVGHLKMLDSLIEGAGLDIVNLGTGRGVSVLEVIAGFEQACGQRVNYRIVDRRPGDVAVSYADPARAERELGWRAVRGLAEMCADAWRWQVNNPQGYTAPVSAA